MSKIAPGDFLRPPSVAVELRPENSGLGFDSHDERSAMQVPANFTQLLTDWRSGQPQALDRLTPLVYDELRRLARGYMRSERGDHTLQATAVVHEAFLRLIQANVPLQDRTHFFSLASRLMRRVLVDHAKSKSRAKRNAGTRDLSPEPEDEAPDNEFDMVALDDALESLAQLEPRLAQVIELYYFGGLTYDQLAATLGASTATVHRDIRLARAWLLNEIGSTRLA
jgi:RNA polymerase sigma factor (TIGR02999 family)